ncbi:MAG: tetratricopeptide repeat protein, partial [Candidatus Cloacimonetes bacterium]|nr:tetratricopeptide repeat protein [Candidatus Cloacimonadota bacterium]
MQKFIKNILALVVLSLLLTSCITMAFFNVYYNAQEYFNEAQKAPLRDNGRPTAQAIQNYNNAIKKCGIILTELKNSNEADDAMLLMGKCFYYKGNSYKQALEKFTELEQYYSNSKLIPESKLYQAKCQHGLGENVEAYKILQEYLLTPEYNKTHPEALLLLADYYILDENYLQAEFYLRKIIDDYKRSKAFAEAYLLLGTIFHDNQEYQQAIDTYKEILNQRIPREIKLQAHYQLALNYLLSENPKQTYKIAKKLSRVETSLSRATAAKLLMARAKAEMGNIEDAEKILENIIQSHPRSLLSAEAAYYIGEINFFLTNNYERAIEFFDKVKKEYTRSEFIAQAVGKSAVAGQILLYSNSSRDIDARQLISDQFKLSEYYLEVLAMPDSAIAVYRDISRQKIELIAYADSLEALLDTLVIAPDSALSVQLDTLMTKRMIFADSIQVLSSLMDTTKISQITNLEIEQNVITDSISLIIAHNDSLLSIERDSLQTARLILKESLRDSTRQLPDDAKFQISVIKQDKDKLDRIMKNTIHENTDSAIVDSLNLIMDNYNNQIEELTYQYQPEQREIARLDSILHLLSLPADSIKTDLAILRLQSNRQLITDTINSIKLSQDSTTVQKFDSLRIEHKNLDFQISETQAEIDTIAFSIVDSLRQKKNRIRDSVILFDEEF